MPYREIFFEKNQPIHILSRAVEGIKIFADKADCYRFIFQLYAANLGRPASNLKRVNIIEAAQALLRGEEISSKFITNQHPPLVHILDFALVVNHYHFHLLPNSENAIPLFVKKLNGGFAMYFNLKHNRKDSLFGSRYKSILIKSDYQLDAISRYINIINPLDVFQPGWREEGLNDQREALEFLENYEFSSFPDKIGKRNAKFLSPKEIRKEYSWEGDFHNKDEYLNFVKDFLTERKQGFFRSSFLE